MTKSAYFQSIQIFVLFVILHFFCGCVQTSNEFQLWGNYSVSRSGKLDRFRYHGIGKHSRSDAAVLVLMYDTKQTSPNFSFAYSNDSTKQLKINGKVVEIDHNKPKIYYNGTKGELLNADLTPELAAIFECGKSPTYDQCMKVWQELNGIGDVSQ